MPWILVRSALLVSVGTLLAGLWLARPDARPGDPDGSAPHARQTGTDSTSAAPAQTQSSTGTAEDPASLVVRGRRPPRRLASEPFNDSEAEKLAAGPVGANVSEADFNAKFKDFDGTVFMRTRIDSPAGLEYRLSITAETQPYGAEFKPLGEFPADGTFKASTPSAWIHLPASSNEGWNVNVTVVPRQGTIPWETATVRMEFATRAAEDAIFHSVDEPLTSDLIAGVYMPRGKGREELNRVRSDHEFARRRLRIAMDAARAAGPPPHLKRLRIHTDMHVEPQRWGGGLVRRDRLAIDLKIAELLGITSVGLGAEGFEGAQEAHWRELAPRFGITGTRFRAWIEGVPAWGPHYQVPDTFPEIVRKYAETDYAARAEKFKDQAAFKLADVFVMGDEIVPMLDPGWAKVAKIREHFERYLQEQRLAPQFFGGASWADVEPTVDRADLAKGKEAVRRFYWFRRFVNETLARTIYKSQTEALLKSFPPARLATANYHAGPVQLGYIGNSNDTGANNLDLFEIGRAGGFKGLMMEDWVATNDFGVGQIAFGSDVLRGAARKLDMPMAGLLVVGWSAPRMFAWLMHGAKDLDLYTYGPVKRIGPAMADDVEDQQDIAATTRILGRVEDVIADAKVKSTKAALLVANTSDVMQVRGMYYGPERQHLYLALTHDYLHVDLISEQDIIEDDLLRQYQVLFISDPQVREAAQNKIKDWVRAGGSLWTGAGGATFNEYNEETPILNEVFGVQKRSLATGASWPLQPVGEWYGSGIGKFPFAPRGVLRTDGSGGMPRVELPVWSARAELEPTSATVFGRYDNGTPAATMNRYGSGRAVVVGALVGEAYVRARWPRGTQNNALRTGGEPARQLATAIADQAGVARVLTASVPGILTSLLTGSRGSSIFAINLGYGDLRNVEFRVPGAGTPTRVRSAADGPIPFRVENGVLVITHPLLRDADVVAIEK